MEIKALAAIKEFFGFRAEEHRSFGEDGQRLSGMRDFAQELGKLTPEDKKELAEGAAKALGKTLVE